MKFRPVDRPPGVYCDGLIVVGTNDHFRLAVAVHVPQCRGTADLSTSQIDGVQYTAAGINGVEIVAARVVGADHDVPVPVIVHVQYARGTFYGRSQTYRA